MAWVVLLLAALFETGWAVGIKYTDGFTRFWPTVATLASMAASVWLLSISVRALPLGTAYAVWTGIGTVGTVVLGVVLFGEPLDAVRILALAMVVVGIGLLRLSYA